MSSPAPLLLGLLLCALLPCCGAARSAPSAEATSRFRQVVPDLIADIRRATVALSTTATEAGLAELPREQREQLRSLREGALRVGATQLRCEPEALREVYALLLAAGVDPAGR